jgi:adenylate cyclase
VDDSAAAAELSGKRQKRLRRIWRSIPNAPRCKMCHRPFGGIGGAAMRAINLGPWPGNPKYCRGCFAALYRSHAGAETDCALLFADVRNSTTLAEGMRPSEFRQLLDRFYQTAFSILVAHDAFVDKFVGDEVIGIFLPSLTDGPPAGEAVRAGLELLTATGGGDEQRTVPIGIGVNAGIAYVGAVGTDEHVEFTALGDIVNVTARLSAAAQAGELLVTVEAMAEAGLSLDGLEPRDLALKGKTSRTRVVVMRDDAPLSGRP